MSDLARSLSVWTCAASFAFAAHGQDDPAPPDTSPPPTAEALLERYRRLDRDQQNTVVRNMERRIQRENDPVLLRIAGFERGLASYPQKLAPIWYLPRDYAPVAADRHVIAAGTTAHARATARMTTFEFVPTMHTAVTYDWLQGKAARIGDGLDDDRRFENYVRGFAPGADHAIARIVEAVDTDPGQRAAGRYFEHLYADRLGSVYAGVTMFDAWSSGLVVEMPDTDAIAYAREILHTQSFVSPIPGDRRRERLYQRIREGFAEHREYRTLRLVAAATFAVANPRIDPTYEPLIRRCRWLWIQCDYDVEAFRRRLEESGDRATFLAAIDHSIESSPEIVEAEGQALLAREEYLRALAARELAARGG